MAKQKGNNKQSASIVALVSGKGGAGKTSAGLSIASLLRKMDFKVLFIDFDLATNGSSYFFKDKLGKKGNIGIWELMKLVEKGTERRETLHLNWDSLLIRLDEGFDFIASRVNFRTKPIDIREVKRENEAMVLSHILEDQEFLKKYHYLVVDCQAGYSTPMDVAVSHANKVVIVSELDAISNDAAEMLIAQAGRKFPEFRRFLLNKLTVDEMEQYEQVAPLFKALNRLPALPYDFSVRAAFGSRQIPVNMQQPSTYLFALFRVIKELFSEQQEKIEQIEQSRINQLTEEYESNIEKLIDQRARLVHELDHISEHQSRIRRRLVIMVGTAFTYLFIGLTAASVFVDLGRYALPGTLGILAIISVLGMYFYNRISRERAIGAEERLKLERELEEINKEIDRFQSLIYSRSKEFRTLFPRET